MTVAVTHERLMAVYELLVQRAKRGLPSPNNLELVKAMGLGAQKYQPWHRFTGHRSRSPSSGSDVLKKLEQLGWISIERVGRNKRRITIKRGGLLLEARELKSQFFNNDEVRVEGVAIPDKSCGDEL